MRLFVAVEVGDAIRDEVTRVQTLLGDAIAAVTTPPHVAWISSLALHLTLRFLGEVDEAAARRLSVLLAEPFRIAPFDVEWLGLGAFPSHRSPRTLWIGVGKGAHELGELEAELSRRIDRGPVVAEPFHPHLTVGRMRTPGVDVNWTQLFQSITVRGVRSRVNRVTLYRSALGPRGPNYTGLAHASLTSSRVEPAADRDPSAKGDS